MGRFLSRLERVGGNPKVKALILSAGLGTRLRPLTYETPKPMIHVGDKPVIQHIVDKLHKSGVFKIMANIHHLPLQMLQIEGVLFSFEKELLGEQNTILSLRHWLSGEPFFVINGDTLSDVDLREMARLLEEKCVPIRHVDDGVFAGTVLYPRNWFTRMDTAPYLYRPGVKWVDMGTPEGLERARKIYGKRNSNYWC